MTDAPPVAARGLVKQYGDIRAVDHVDLTVQQGDVYGFLGPNGAGKTTAMRMMLGLLRPDEGAVQLFGRDPQHGTPAALDGVAGFVETPRFYSYLSGRTNLELLAALDGGDAATRIDDVLARVELGPRAKDRVGNYSQGMRQRLGLAASLLRNPRLLIIDEPTNGLDPGGIRDMRDMIRGLAAQGMTILLSSHMLVEVEELCTRLAVIRGGRIVYEGTMASFRASATPRYRLRTTDQARAGELVAAALAAAAATVGTPVAAPTVEPDGSLVFGGDEALAIALSRQLVGAGLGIAALVPEAATLEELFFELTEGAAATAADGAPA